jgi:hypothetical protein
MTQWPQERPISIAPRFRPVPTDYAPDEPELTREEADRKAVRAWWRGVVFGGLLVGATFIAGAAFADPLNITGTIVDMQPAPPPAVAKVTMDNWSANGPQDDAVYLLTMPGLAVEVEFTWDAGQIGEDRVTVIPPDGFICEPLDCQMTVPEGSIGRVMIMPWVGG